MFANIGTKLKKTAKVVCVAGIILSVIFGIYMIIKGIEMTEDYDTMATGYGMIISGVVYGIMLAGFSWIYGLLLFVFGDLSDRLTNVETGVKEICADLNPAAAAQEKAVTGPEDPDDERWESVRSFLEEMEKEKNAVGIWILWRKYKLSDKYKDADEYIRRHRTLEMMNGETEKIGEIRKDIRSLLNK
ncbi:hypothetical protein JS518_15275 [Clostridiales bacterium FE2010]|nr:hypothetical protein JS518_15275 [Clostridiales bacterium FE2010]